MKNLKGDLFNFNWYPSEYLYHESETTYCLAAEHHTSDMIMMGGTFLR